jgi:hypothetical protein
MDENQIKEYILKYEKSFNKNQINSQLIKSGATEQEIKNVEFKMNNYSNIQTDITKKKNKSKLIMIKKITIIGILLMFSLFFLFQGIFDKENNFDNSESDYIKNLESRIDYSDFEAKVLLFGEDSFKIQRSLGGFIIYVNNSNMNKLTFKVEEIETLNRLDNENLGKIISYFSVDSDKIGDNYTIDNPLFTKSIVNFKAKIKEDISFHNSALLSIVEIKFYIGDEFVGEKQIEIPWLIK